MCWDGIGTETPIYHRNALITDVRVMCIRPPVQLWVIIKQTRNTNFKISIVCRTYMLSHRIGEFVPWLPLWRQTCCKWTRLVNIAAAAKMFAVDYIAMFVWGCNRHGALGLPKHADQWTPMRVVSAAVLFFFFFCRFVLCPLTQYSSLAGCFRAAD